MQLTSSQRWAFGAVGLAILIACSPQKPDGAPVPQPHEPTLSSALAGAPAGDIVPTPPPVTGGDAIAPGFAGRWAAVEAECSDSAKTFDLSAHSFAIPGRNACAVTNLQEEHPTGRSAVFSATADCTAENPAASDRFTLNFGAADTVMQLQHNDQAPVRLVHCP